MVDEAIFRNRKRFILTSIMKDFMDRYGHLESPEEMQAAMKRDGLGFLVDEINSDPDYVQFFIREHEEEMMGSIRRYHGSGSMPAQETPVQRRSLEGGIIFRSIPNLPLIIREVFDRITGNELEA